MLTHRPGMFSTVFPTNESEIENVALCASGIGSSKPFQCLVSNIIPNHDLLEKTQCFPYYTYSENGSDRHENITDWALTQFQARYCLEITKRDIFHYIYAMLHHPQYRERYAVNLNRDLPHIPLIKETEIFKLCTHIGKQLVELHLNYEQVPEYPLKWAESIAEPVNWRLEKMRLTPDKGSIVVNEWLTLENLPQVCFNFRLGNRSAIEWVIDQYRVSEDKRSGIVSDPNREDDPEYIVRLVGRVVTVSVETVRLVKELAQGVSQEDWLDE